VLPTLRLKNELFLKNKRKMEEEKYMMVAEDFIKEPPAVPCCQKKNNGLSELDFSPRNSTVAKPECIILSPLETNMDNGDKVEEGRERSGSQLHETKVPETNSVQTQEMKSTISNLRSLLKECFRQLQEERKQSANLLNQVAELESKVLTYNQVITQLLNQQQSPSQTGKESDLETVNEAVQVSTNEDTKQEKKPTKTFSTAAKAVLSSVKLKQASKKQNNKTAKLMKQNMTEQSLLSTCGDTFNSKATDIEEELDLEGRPSRFNNLLSPDEGFAEYIEGEGNPKESTRKRSQKWRKTGMKTLSTDFRDVF